MNIFNRIDELKELGHNTTKIRAFLTIDDFSKKDIDSALKSVNTRKVGFNAAYLEWLGLAPRNKQEAEDYVNGKGEYGEVSDNIPRFMSRHMGIWELAQTIWNTKMYDEEPEPEGMGAPEKERSQEDIDEEHRQETIQAAWDRLKRAKLKPKKQNKNINPDKVSYLNDEELTKAYTEYYKSHS